MIIKIINNLSHKTDIQIFDFYLTRCLQVVYMSAVAVLDHF